MTRLEAERGGEVLRDWTIIDLRNKKFWKAQVCL